MAMTRRARVIHALLAALAIADASCKKEARRHRIDDDTEEEAAPARPSARARVSAPAALPTPSSPAVVDPPSAVTVAPLPPPVPPGAPIGPPLSATNASRVKERWAATIGGWGKAVAISTHHAKVAASSGGLVQTFDLATGAPAHARPPSGCGGVVAMGFSPTALVVVCDHGIVELDPVSLEKRKTLLVRGPEISAGSVRAPWVAVSHADGVLARYSLEGKDVVEIPVHGPTVDVESIDVSRDGARAAVGFRSGAVWAWDWSSPATEIDVATYRTHVSAVAFSPDGSLLAEEGPSFGVSVWRFDSAKRTAVAAGELRTDESWTNGLFITNDGALLVAGTSSGYAVITKAGKTSFGGYESVEDLAIDESFTAFGGIDRSGTVRVFSVR